MNYLEKKIHELTGCNPENVSAIEDVLRSTILNYQTIDNLSARVLNKAIKEAHSFWLFMQTPEGIAEMERSEREVLGL